MTFTDEKLAKLRKYLEENATILANDSKIKQIPYYRGDESLREYLWTIIDVPVLGRIEMYFTSSSSILKINNVLVEKQRVLSFNFEEINRILLAAFKQKTIDDTKNWFNKI